jgi:hypothetical protein
MKKIWLFSVALVALSGGMFADSIYTGSGTTTVGALISVPTTAVFSAVYNSGTAPQGQLAYTGSAVAAPAIGVAFWNNPTSDGTPPPSPALVDGHIANVGDVLAGLATGTNLIGTTNLTGTPSTVTPNTGTVINGSYFADTVGGTTNGNGVTTYTSGTSLTPALEFQFQSAQTAFTISLLFADSSQDTGVTGGATSIGTYIIMGGVFTEASVLDGAVANNTTGTATALTVTNAQHNSELVVNNGTIYGFYATVCYVWNGTTCTASVTYTTGNGNFITPTTIDSANTLASGSGYLNALGWNHFALFELASGEEVLGFTDTFNTIGSTVGDNEGLGDYNDVIIGLVGNQGVSTPEPGTIAIMGLGLAGLGLLGRRRFAKK